jgi:RNase P/RNase MRP subunit p29
MKVLRILLVGAVLLVGSVNVAHSADKYLFYIHGCCVKDKDDPKVTAYETIVQELKNSGLKVTFELRYSDVSDSDEAAHKHAAKIADQVRSLLAKGTKPEDITVSGFSLGSNTSLLVSGLVANPNVNYVLLAGCPVKPSVPVTIDFTKLKGRILSIVDSKDEKFGSCKGRISDDMLRKEVVLETGLGHKLFLQTDAEHFKLWKEPLENWAKGK